MVRVAVLSWRSPGDPDAGGSELHAKEVLARWQDEGVDVTMFARDDGGSEPRSEDVPFRVERVGSTYSVFPAAVAAVLRQRRKFDAVVEIMNGVPFWSPVWWRGPNIVWLHHLHTDMWKQSLPPVIASVGRWNERRVVPQVYRRTPVVTLAETGRTALTDIGFRSVHVVSPGVDECFDGPLDDELPTSTRLIVVGRLAPVKQIEELLRVLHQARSQGLVVDVDLVGDGPLRSSIERWKRAESADWLTIHGRVGTDSLVDLYRGAAILVSASSSEGWGMTITEAARCGKPAVVTDVTGHRASVIDGVTGDLVSRVEDLPTAISRLLADEQRWRHYASAAHVRAQQMSWDTAASEHLALLREVAR